MQCPMPSTPSKLEVWDNLLEGRLYDCPRPTQDTRLFMNDMTSQIGLKTKILNSIQGMGSCKRSCRDRITENQNQRETFYCKD